MIPTPPASIETVPWDSRTTNPNIFTIYSTVKTPVPTNKIKEERVIYRPAAASDTAAVKRAGYRWAKISKTYPDPTPAPVTTSPTIATLSPVQPATLETVEWNARTTSSLFTIHLKTTTPVPPNKIREERIIYRPAAGDDTAAVKRAGYRWARIVKTYTDPNYIPTSPPAATPPPSQPSINAVQLAADLTAAAADGPLFNQGIAEAITNLVPAQYQQVVGIITQSVLDVLPAGPTTQPTTPPPPPPPPPPEPPALDPKLRNALLLTAGVGAVYFIFIR